MRGKLCYYAFSEDGKDFIINDGTESFLAFNGTNDGKECIWYFFLNLLLLNLVYYKFKHNFN